MANEDQEQWHLPEPLRITNPKVAEAAAELRKELSARVISPFARRSPQEFAQIRAYARIEHLTMALRQVDQQISENRGRVSARELHAASVALATRLAENLAIIGHYAMAAQVHPDPRYQQEYAKQIQTNVTL